MTELDEVVETLIEPFKAWRQQNQALLSYLECKRFVNQQMDERPGIRMRIASKLLERLNQEQ